MPLSLNDIKSELSYAYVHAVAARAGCECHVATRHSDNRGVDVRLPASGGFPPTAVRTMFDVYAQLKATTAPILVREGRISFDLEVGQYNNMRATTVGNLCLLVVLFLPPSEQDWLRCTPQALTLKNCAYWVSLFGAPERANRRSVRVWLPRRNRFTPESLKDIVNRAAHKVEVPYEA